MILRYQVNHNKMSGDVWLSCPGSRPRHLGVAHTAHGVGVLIDRHGLIRTGEWSCSYGRPVRSALVAFRVRRASA